MIRLLSPQDQWEMRLPRINIPPISQKDNYFLFYLFSGNFTLMFCPLKLWWLLMAIWLRRKIHTIKKDKLLYVE